MLTLIPPILLNHVKFHLHRATLSVLNVKSSVLVEKAWQSPWQRDQKTVGCSHHINAGLVYINLTQAKVTWEERILVEDLPPSDWPEALSVGAFS